MTETFYERALAPFRDPRMFDPALVCVEGRSGLEGHAGLSLLTSALGHKTGEDAWYGSSFALLERAVGEPCDDISLYSGLSGLLFAARYAARSVDDYGSLIVQLERHIEAELERQLPQAATALATSFQYDLIAGWAGVIIGARHHPRIVARLLDHVEWVFASTERWTLSGIIGGQPVQGARNLSLAHGLSGVICAIAVAAPQRRDLLERLGRLLRNEVESYKPPEQWRTVIRSDGKPGMASNASWCYGIPGIALGLFQAGRLAGIAELEEDALRALAQLAKIDVVFGDACLCHGSAGTALLLFLFGRLMSDSAMLEAARRVGERVTSDYRPNNGWLFLNGDGELREAVTFINGTTGVLLCLATMDAMIDEGWLNAIGIAPTVCCP